MWRQLIAVFSFILLLQRPTFVSTTSTRFAKRQEDSLWNFRCGSTKIFDYKFLLAAAEAANHEFLSQGVSDFAGSNSKYPLTYKGDLKFGQEPVVLLWPLSENRKAESQPVEVGEWFLVLAEDVPLRIVGVIFGNTDEYVKCERERPDTHKLPQPLKLGYRCLYSEFSPTAIEQARVVCSRHRTRKFSKICVESPPWPFSRGKSLFGNQGPLFAWPIRPDGGFHRGALTKLILNQYDKVIGMVEENHGKTHLCEPYKAAKNPPPRILAIIA